MGDNRLYRSSTNYMLAGVCGGIAEYFNIDPTLVRLGWVLFSALGGSGILAYIIAAIIIPKQIKEEAVNFVKKFTAFVLQFWKYMLQ